MMRRSYFCLVLVLLSGAALSAPQPERITFVRNGQVYVSGGDGTSVKQLSTGQSVKRMPKWSPDGSKIVYEDPVVNDKSRGDLVVIDANGKLIGRYPIATVTDTGVIIAGMRFIESIGWRDNETVFAMGSINPYVAEYRAINIHTRKMEGFLGFDFATCTSSGRVAYWNAVYPQSKVMSLGTSLDARNAKPRFEFPDVRALPTIQIPIAWDKRCDELAFIDPQPPMRLVVIAVDRRDSEPRLSLVPNSPTALDALTVRTVPQGFLVGKDGGLLYDTAAARWAVTPVAVLNAMKAEQARRTRVESALGGIDPDWWPPNLP